MILSDAVLDDKGNILLPKGIELTSALLASLARHQIDTVAIAEGGLSAEEASAQDHRRTARITYLFRQPGGLEAAPQSRSDADLLLHQFILHYRSSDPT